MMASLCQSTTTYVRIPLLPANRCSSTSSSSSLMASATPPPPPPMMKRRSRSSHVVCMAPHIERVVRRSPMEFPVEFEPNRYGRKADIIPQFSPMKTLLPPPLPLDPPEVDEFEEEEEEGEGEGEGEGGEGGENPIDPGNPGLE